MTPTRHAREVGVGNPKEIPMTIFSAHDENASVGGSGQTAPPVGAKLHLLSHRHRRGEYGRAIADLWSEWERTGRIQSDPYGCQLDHVRAVQEHILGAQRRGLWQEPIDLDRYDFPWYAQASMALARAAVPVLVLALFIALVAVIRTTS